MTGYTTAFVVDQTPQQAFDAITAVRGWWSRGAEGVSDQLGGEFVHRYQDVHRYQVRVTTLEPGRRVVWRVLDNYFNFISDQHEWQDTEVVFENPREDGDAPAHQDAATAQRSKRAPHVVSVAAER
jgi:hypothetical protein